MRVCAIVVIREENNNDLSYQNSLMPTLEETIMHGCRVVSSRNESINIFPGYDLIITVHINIQGNNSFNSR